MSVNTLITKAILAGALGAATLAAASPAMADDRRWHRHRDGGDTAGAAVAGGIIGLALGAAIASNGRDRDYYDDRYYYHRRPHARVYVYHEYPRYHRGWGRPAYRYYHPRERYYRGYNGYGGYDGYYRRGW